MESDFNIETKANKMYVPASGVILVILSSVFDSPEFHFQIINSVCNIRLVYFIQSVPYFWLFVWNP